VSCTEFLKGYEINKSISKGNSFTLIDTAGYSESKSVELNVAQQIRISDAIKEAKSVKIVVLIDWNSILALKG
jgi:predicted GTPase